MKPPTQWFESKDKIAVDSDASTSSMASSISSTSQGIAGQFKSMGTAVSSAVGKAKNAVTATFTSDVESSDATSLASLPTSLGPEVWVANGQLCEAQNNFPKALDNYSKALEKDPNNEAALLSIARLYVRQDRSEQAAEFFRKAIAANPSAAGSHNELALVLQEQGKTPEAQAEIQKAIALDAANPRYRNNLAGMLVAVGRSDEAVAQLEQVFPPAVANYNVAYLHFTNNNLAGAQQHLETALRADPNLGQARELLDQLRGSPTAQSAVAAYGAAQQIYRTAQAVGQPAQAGSAVYQQPASTPTTSPSQFQPQTQPLAPPANSSQTQPSLQNVVVQGYGQAAPPSSQTNLSSLPSNPAFAVPPVAPVGQGYPAPTLGGQPSGMPVNSYPATSSTPAQPVSFGQPSNRYQH